MPDRVIMLVRFGIERERLEMRVLIAAVLVSFFCSTDGWAQSRVAAEPIVGLRENAPRHYALTGARVVIEPGRVIDGATVLIEGTSIKAVGKEVIIPAGTMTIDCSERTIYAGLIDAWSEVEVPAEPSEAAHWNSNVTPQRSSSRVASKGSGDAAKLRSQGITARLIAPQGGIIKGSSCVVLLSDSEPGRVLLKTDAWHHLQLSVPRIRTRSRYPNSPMGAVALLRQTMYDARWYEAAWTAYRARTKLPRPETNVALATLAAAIQHDTFVIDAPNERMAIRAANIAQEFSLRMIIRGSGREYRQLDEIAATNRPILVPVDFPQAPNVKTAQSASETTLQQLLHWDLAPENPGRLVDAGVPICLTSDGLKDVGKFLKQVRKAVDRGLSPAAALAAITTQPASLLQIDDVAGRVQPGMLANLVVASGDLFDAKTKVMETWIAGDRFVISPPKDIGVDELVGNWSIKFRTGNTNVSLRLDLQRSGDKLTGVLRNPNQTDSSVEEARTPAPSNADQAAANPADQDDTKQPSAKQPSAKLRDLVRQRDRMTASVRLDQLDQSLPRGTSRLNLVTVADLQTPGGERQHTIVFGSIDLPNGESPIIEMKPINAPAEEDGGGHANGEENAGDSDSGDNEPDDKKSDGKDSADDGEKDDGSEPNAEQIAKQTQPDDQHPPESTPVLFPLGAYGVTEPIADAEHVLFRGATVWTCDDAGKIENGDVRIKDGRIVEVGPSLTVPDGCRVIDALGKHITPGLIDCHTHMGTDGGVNESGQAVTAEVRIGDFIDNSDIMIYRQLAGGLTTANILHGSANPIGGQNQVIKLRWGGTMDALRMKEAPAGIKFALGENVKRTQSRYPNTRMGVEQMMRDQLLAAREYDAAWRRWRTGDRGDSLPPRTDLQLEAMAEVQRGERWIHCHSYRQDEIVATLDLLDEFGIQIGTLQHISEGYKVADRMAQHGAMGSAFSDWWAYKFEVYDAIPYNGALMHDQGIVVSFNSDDREIARHLNTEAAKATKYGGVPEEEALKFVTLNPAKQLRIDQHVGSITPGKHADLAIWSGRPLSTLSRCEQTWIDGRRYFDLQNDRAMRSRDANLRSRMIQKALDGGNASQVADKSVAEEDRWQRSDIYCYTHGSVKHDSNTIQTEQTSN